ncbi:MAG: hypothetical protein OXG56_11310 [Gammaproteobacteria bacterium]|nr:hypothetical protein [Gammaproteobacteria bacterium]
MDKPVHDPDIDSLDNEGAERIGEIEKHHINLRRVSIGAAVIVLVLAAILEYYIFCNLTQWNNSLGHYIVFLAIAPMVSITTIVVFVLLASFKKSNEVKVPPAAHAASVALGENGT